MITNNIRKGGAFIVISVIVAFLAGFFAHWNILEKWELKIHNNFFTATKPSADIIIVGIDQKSINAETGLGTVQNWPRTYYAQAISNIAKNHPKIIGIDILFRSPSNFLSTEDLTKIINTQSTENTITNLLQNYISATHPYDEALAKAISDAGNVILVNSINFTKQIAEENFTKTLEASSENNSIPIINNAGLSSGANTITFEKDDIVRKIPIGVLLNNTFKNSFSFAIAKGVLGLDIKTTENPQINSETYTIQSDKNTLNIPIDHGFTNINYAAPPYPNGYKTIPFIDVYNGIISSGTFTNKIVLIGWVNAALKDTFPTPHLSSTGRMMPGVEIHANVIQMLLEGNFLEKESPIFIALITFLYALLITFCAGYLRMRWAPLYLAVFFIDYWFFAKYAFAHGLPGISGSSIINGETVRHKMLFAIATPYVCMAIAYITTLAYRYTTEVKSRLALKTAFSYYLAPAVVEKIADQPEKVQLGGERRDMTFLFSDIHDFTPFSESRDPAEVAKTLNEYFTAMAECVFAENGTLDKFEGDALMAFWGAPLEQKDHATRAIRAAIRMKLALKKLHEKWAQENRPLLYCRIGINSGEAIVGNMGSNRRFDYTAIGDNVNLAARLEQANKQFDSRLLISEATMKRMKEDPTAEQVSKLPWKALGEITVKGKSNTIPVWTLQDL